MTDDAKGMPERFDCVTVTKNGETYDDMRLKPTGEWVRYRDVASRFTALEAENARLREALTKIAFEVDHERAIAEPLSMLNRRILNIAREALTPKGGAV